MSKGITPNHIVPPSMKAAMNKVIATRFHSNVIGRKASSDEGGSYIVWNKPRPKVPE
jgi:hypothetical protein